MRVIPMPLRNSTSEVIARAASRLFKAACSSNYTTRAIGDVGKVVSGGTPDTKSPRFWDGDIVWITPKDLGKQRNVEIAQSERCITQEGSARSSAKVLPVGTVVLSSRAPIGHLGITAVPLATNQGFKSIIPNGSVNSRFLFHMLRGSIDDLQSFGRGNTFAEIPARVVKEYRIPFPPQVIQGEISHFLDALYEKLSGAPDGLPSLPGPFAEQRRIVAKIERLAAKIDEARGGEVIR